MRLRPLVALVSAGLLLNTSAFANMDNFRFSGFASVVAGTVVDGDGYWARLPDAGGQYTSGIEFEPESLLGLQGRYAATTKLSLTAQVVMRGANDFDPDLEWFYASYQINPDTSLMVGRYRLPVYHFSEYMDIGIAYPWLRVPTDAYSLAVTNIQGASLSHSVDWEIGVTQLRLYAGQQDTRPNKLLTTIEQYKTGQIYNQQGQFIGVQDLLAEKDYKDLVGFVADTHIDWFNVRLSYLKGNEQYRLYGPADQGRPLIAGGEWTGTRFFDVSLVAELGYAMLMAEFNDYKDIYRSWFVSGVYRIDEWSLYAYATQFESDLRFIAPGGISAGTESPVSGSVDDEYHSIGVGFRYNINPRTAVKFEVINFEDHGDAAVFVDEDQDGETSAVAVSAALQLTF